MTRDCKHGMLARSCEVCELRAEVERLRSALRTFVDDDDHVYGRGHTDRSRAGRAALGDVLDVIHTCPETSRPNVFDLACLACVASLREHGFDPSAPTAKGEP